MSESRKERAAIASVLATLESWDRATTAEKLEVASRLEEFLGSQVRLTGLETHALGDQQHTLAVFARGDLTFALLPGYVGELGYDRARHALPTELASEYAEFMAETAANAEKPIADYVRRALTPLRRVTLPPFLVQMAPTPLERLNQQADGTWLLDDGPRWPDVLSEIAADGFRFPTSDEWEYACSGGTRSFFRWGDMWPPIDWTPEEQRPSDFWQEDLLPNAFGLIIAEDPWRLEFCAEPHIVRGGDGGTTCSAGVGRYNEWLTLATPYCWLFPQRIIDRLRRPLLRRVLDLPAAFGTT